MEIEWNEVGLPVVRCPVCEKNGLENNERYPPAELFMHLKSRAHTKEDLADLKKEEAHFNDAAFYD